MIRKTLLAAALSTATLAAAPAFAGGQVSIDIAPATQEQDDAMRLGLGMYGLFNGIKNAGIKQKGSGNSAGVAQNGSGNLGIVHQEGNGHNGTVSQNGNCNAYGLFQFGKNTNANVEQNGDCQTGATVQFGW